MTGLYITKKKIMLYKRQDIGQTQGKMHLVEKKELCHLK